MNWDDLRCFLAVARAGRIAEAAGRLDMDATTVGRRIRRLEKAIGETLFEQTGAGQRLTEAGRRMQLRVEEADASLSRLGEPDGGGAGGRVRLSTSEGFGTWFVARHLGDFAAREPGIAIDLVASSGFLSPSRREADLAIMLARPAKGPLVSRKLTSYALRLYAAPAYLQARPPLRAAADLARHDLISYIPDLLYAPELNYFGEVAAGSDPRLRSSSINAQHRLAAGGNGIAILPCFIGDRDPTLRRVLEEVRIQRSFWLVTHRDGLGARRNRCLWDWLVELVRRERTTLLG